MGSNIEKSKPTRAKNSPSTKARTKTEMPKPKKTTEASRSASATPLAPSREQIALRAYYIAEERRRRGVAGTHQDDWLEAERQLATGRRQASA